MSTATSRLRRVGVGGLAAAVVLGTALTGAGTANAWVSGAVTLGLTTPATETTVYPGSANQPVAPVTIGVNGWRVGDSLEVTLENPAATCATPATSLGFSAAPTVAAAPTPSPVPGEVSPTFNTTLGSSSPACTTAGVTDVFTITFTNVDAATGQGSLLNLTNILATVGSGLTGVVQVAVNPVEGNSGTAPTPPAPVTVANIAQARVAATPTTGKPDTTIAAPTVTVTEVTAGTVGDLTFTLDGGANWATAGTLAKPSGITEPVSVTGAGTPTLTYTLSPATTTPGTFTLSGATIALPTDHEAVGVTVDSTSPAFTAVTLPYASAIGQDRVFGENRYATAAAAFRAAGGVSSGAAVLATGLNFPDALAANALAGDLGTGVLLTGTNSLPAETREALIDAASGSYLTVYVVGGELAISQAVVDEIRELGLNPDIAGDVLNPVRVIRVAGSDRTKTAEAVAARVATAGSAAVNGTSASTAIVASGQNYPDALAIGPASYANVLPLFLTQRDGTLSDSTQEALAATGATNVIIVGGPDAVPTAVETQLDAQYNVLRLSGMSRYDTAAAIANWELQAPLATNTGGLDWADGDTVAYLATGTNFPDALAGGPAAGVDASALFLVPLSASETSVLSSYTADEFSSVTAFGGTLVVSNAVRTAAAVATAG